MSSEAKSPVNVEIGAKASLEIKAEVPKASMGRLVDALTDAIRPFTEARGLRADQIRLQREDVLIEIAKKAKLRADAEAKAIESVPNKFLVTFLEKASLEEPDSVLVEMWSRLLVEAGQTRDPKLNVYIDILSKINILDARVLQSVCLASDYKNGVSWPLGHFEDNKRRILDNVKLLHYAGNDYERNSVLEKQALWEKFKGAAKVEYGNLLHATVVALNTGGSSYFYTNDFGEANASLSIDRLERESLLKKSLIEFSVEGKARHGTVSYFELTYLAVDLVRVCTRGFTEPLDFEVNNLTP